MILGSIALHALLVAITFPFWHRLTLQNRLVSAQPIALQFVELPEENPADPLPSTTPVSPGLTSPSPASPPANPVPSPNPSGLGFTAATPSPVPTSPARDPEQLEPFITSSSSPPPLPTALPSPVSAPDRALPLDASTPTPTEPSPTAPNFPTIPIDVPIPDLSEQLPTESVDPSSLARTGIDPEATPLMLVASLTVEPIPDLLATTESIATPRDGVTRQEVADSVSAPCVGAVTPDAVRALGTTVAVQATTDANGQVVQTLVRESSQNPAYDQLIQCVAQHWNLQPATIAGVASPSQALLMRIVIERKAP